ncbi:MAG: MFS transporter [Bacteroidota bacterium]
MNKSTFPYLPFDPNKFPFFYGWVIIFIGTVGVLMSTPGQTIGLSTFTDSLIEALMINRDQLSLAYMFGTISSSLLLTRAGKLYDRYGVRPVAILASVGLAFGLLYLSQIDLVTQIVADRLALQNTLYAAFPLVLLGFLCIRFFGQGVLTLVSRTMMMKWFDERRGLALGFSNVMMVLGFSYAPVVFEYLIQGYGWRAAWQYMAVALLFVFPIIIFCFFRNDPRDVGLTPDGNFLKTKNANQPIRFPVSKDYELKEVRRTFTFWVCALFVSMTGLYNTGFAFHIVSIFEQIGTPRAEAIRIFQWSAIVAVVSTLVLSAWSDYVRMRYLLYLKGMAALIGLLGFIFLEQGAIAYWSLVVGNGLLNALYSVIGAVIWARFYGKKQLGAIIGQVMMLTVFASAIGPYLFSQSLSISGSYDTSGWICLAIYLSLAIGAFWVKNPQLGKEE